jgi:hypothetical protein
MTPLRRVLPRLGGLVLFTALPAVAAAQQTSAAVESSIGSTLAEASSGSMTIDGPPAPVPPAVITRDENGRATVRAVRLERPLEIDGQLDEDVYDRVPGAGGFIQQEPREGDPATEQTDVWIFFDDRNLYVSARCWDSQPDRWVVNELRRDLNNITNNENFSVVLDTFYDRRNGFFFQTTPLGAVRDQTFTDEGNGNTSWNTIWSVKAGRFEGGWSLEMAIPFKSLRYRGAGAQLWGINFRRMVKWKNEESYLTRMAAAWGNQAVFHVSAAGNLVGLETPAQSMNLEVKPYVASSLTTNQASDDPFSNRFDGDIGLDFKYGVTRSLIADVTVNTDFAQIEEDVQQVNLTRFSLFFPEKRDFFLEGQGLFAFGSIVGASLSANTGGDVPILFFSRRIGLSEGQAVPITVGGRLTGTVGKYGIGAMQIRTNDKPEAGALETDFTVLRLKRDVLRRSNVGLIVTHRTPDVDGGGSNQTLGLDANFAFFTNITFSTYYARTAGSSENGDESSYRAKFEYAADRYGVSAEHLLVGDDFNPEVGFIRRSDFRRSSLTARFSPRPRSSRLVRKYTWDAGFDYITDGANTRVENRAASSAFQIEFTNSDQWKVEYTDDYELLPEDFEIADDVVLPTGGYQFQNVAAEYQLGQHRRISGRIRVGTGSFYDGTRRELTFGSGRAALSTRLNIEPGLTLNWVDLPQGSFETQLATARVIFTPSPRSLVSGLFQFNASARTLSSSVRLRWEYTPGSELFVVYTDNRNTLVSRDPRLLNRSFAVKITRLVRF